VEHMKPYMRHLARIHREFTARTLLSFLLSFTSFVGSRARERSAFSAASFHVSEGIIPLNPARGVKRPADNHREVRLTRARH